MPGVVTIAEESTAWPGVTRPTHLGGLGFGFKWNMGWMHDSLDYMSHEPIYRQYHHHEMTFAMVYAWSEQFILPISHDEVVHGKGSLLGKMPGDRWQKLANLRAYLAYMWAHPGKQLIFMGSEFAQEAEWNEGRGLDWWLLDNAENAGMLALVGDINRAYTANASMWSLDNDPGGFEWIDANDAGSNVFTWLRWGSDGSVMACLSNFAPSRGRTTGLGCRSAAAGQRSSTPTPPRTGAPAWATWARSSPGRTPGTAGRRRRRSRCRPGVVWLRHDG